MRGRGLVTLSYSIRQLFSVLSRHPSGGAGFQHAKAIGAFYIAADEQSKQLVAQIEQAEVEIAKWKNEIKKETQFNRKVEYHMKIQQLTKQIEQWKQQLHGKEQHDGKTGRKIIGSHQNEH
ncbi:DUF4391 domain-containing protein [Geobacillus thermoleovorans]|uniref:DUF4391 domain-containing protein n=1 Tax=Geobacillus thermoleovorans TaxID=33941 RepID=UPI001F27777E|nr:DUF4391 domain-containing protein [Geobacillus thermoleovorans]